MKNIECLIGIKKIMSIVPQMHNLCSKEMLWHGLELQILVGE